MSNRNLCTGTPFNDNINWWKRGWTQNSGCCSSRTRFDLKQIMILYFLLKITIWCCILKGETLDFILTVSKNQAMIDMMVISEGHCKDFNLTHTLNINYDSSLNDIISDEKKPKQLVSIMNRLFLYAWNVEEKCTFDFPSNIMYLYFILKI